MNIPNSRNSNRSCFYFFEETKLNDFLVPNELKTKILINAYFVKAIVHPFYGNHLEK